MDPTYLDQLEIILRIVAAMFMGGLIGIERELAKRPAGFRTHMLVAGGTALFVCIGPHMVQHYLKAQEIQSMASDPLRIFEAIATAIAFLGAGTIIQHGSADKVRGLTTAGSLFLAGGVGIASALELWILAAGTTFLALLLLTVLNKFEHWMQAKTDASSED